MTFFSILKYTVCSMLKVTLYLILFYPNLNVFFLLFCGTCMFKGAHHLNKIHKTQVLTETFIAENGVIQKEGIKAFVLSFHFLTIYHRFKSTAVIDHILFYL